MSLTTYTTYNEVRAVLGVSMTELPDTILSQPIYSTLLDLALEDVNVNIPAHFATVSALPTPSSAQNRFLDLVKLYAPYSTAKELLVSLPLFSVQSLTDGRAEFTRQNDVFEDVRDGVESALLSLRARLSASYAGLTVTSATIRPTLVMTVASALGFDPVKAL